jgi:hypothetical protein
VEHYDFDMVSVIISEAIADSRAAASSVALLAISTLVTLLIAKEILSGLNSARARRLNSALTVAIVPLLLVFIISAAFGLFNVLR